MTALRAPSAAFLSAFVSVVRAELAPASAQPFANRLPLLQRLRTTAHLIPAALVPIPGLFRDIWEGILNAVPKKKTSHMKKRHRQLAGKALKDVTALNKCSACGRVKRAHVLCPYCVQSVRQWLRNGFKTKQEVNEEEREKYEIYNKERRIMGLKPLELPKELKDDQSKAAGAT